ncbi:CatB-related O-acetyltransferase [Roseomonas sp. SG15]|uniref:CatB-related O-acetyltransferase n=2 Tax=Roseomonas indoligenes TaxID=2820811 RepID=A0A940S4C1_9PROT|nr:CatB-related O-acetyltransferase [Pararoseomonas indoligenes]
MGAFSYSHSPLSNWMRIGRYCSIASKLEIMGTAHPLDRVSTSPFTYQAFDSHPHLTAFARANRPGFRPQQSFAKGAMGVVLENDVWIGQAVLLRRGVRIGTGAVVAAGAVVVKDVPPYAIVGGNPARVIRFRFDPDTAGRLLESRWWDYAFTDFENFDVTAPAAFAEAVITAARDGRIQPFSPRPFRPAAPDEAV